MRQSSRPSNAPTWDWAINPLPMMPRWMRLDGAVWPQSRPEKNVGAAAAASNPVTLWRSATRRVKRGNGGVVWDIRKRGNPGERIG